MVKMHTAAVQRDEYVDKEMDKHHERLARHRHDLETMRAQISVLEEENFKKRADPLPFASSHGPPSHPRLCDPRLFPPTAIRNSSVSSTANSPHLHRGWTALRLPNFGYLIS